METGFTDADRLKDLKAFDDTKAGVKGLIDAGITRVPKIFIRPPDELAEELNISRSTEQAPVIDLTGVRSTDDRRKKVVDQLRQASEEWGFFQVVNHSIPAQVMDGMLAGIHEFHEQDAELKKNLYSRDRGNKFKYESNIDLYHSRAATWKDTLTINLLFDNHLERDELPEICRTAAFDYIDHVTKLAETLFELLSEALGLKLESLNDMNCAKGRTLLCHYYPACPEPELTLGVKRHTDPSFLTILLQDQIGALQCLHNNEWTDVPPVPGGLVVNIADLLQIVLNDKFKSVEHRVIANNIGPRISVACFFMGTAVPPVIYGPAKEIISEENPAVYREFTVMEYIQKFFSRSIDRTRLDYFRI